MDKLPVTVIILTYNEEGNIEACLQSVHGWVERIFVVDSFSKDKTIDIVRRYTSDVYTHEFEDYGRQRNWALKNLPINTEWVMNIDADQRITGGLKNELEIIFSKCVGPDIFGFMMPTKTIFMGRWLRHGGHYPIYRNYLFRKGFGACEERKYHQHFIVNGKTARLKGDVEDIIASDISTMIDRHNKWTSGEAEEVLTGEVDTGHIRPRLFGNPIERRRWFRVKVYWRLPPYLRSFLYFIYRYFILFGFMDGTEGLIFHAIQGLFVHFLVDAKICEAKRKMKVCP